MLITALVLLIVAITAAGIGVLATWDQGVPPIMYWVAIATLAAGLGMLLGYMFQGSPEREGS